MTKIQAYFFREVLTPFAAVLFGLTTVALLTQGLQRLDIIVDRRQSGAEFLWVTLLAMPQVIALLLPLACFFAVTYAVNRLLTENELVAAYAGGLSRVQIATPVIRFATLVALAHLAMTTLVQPASYRELRETLFDIRADLAAALVREGAFTSPAEGLTIYARETEAGGRMYDLFIDDRRNGAEDRITYTARRGAVATSAGAPALVLFDGQIQQPKGDGSIDLLDFDQYVVELGSFQGAADEVLLKPSDRFLSELFFLDRTHYYDNNNVEAFLAEGHSRIASPLLNFALALTALAVLLTGDLNRLGYGWRIGIASVLALLFRLVSLAIQAACADAPALNVLQYAFPIGVAWAALWMLAAARLPRSRIASSREGVTLGRSAA